MTFPFGHMIGAWILGKAYEKVSKKKLHKNTWFFLLIGSIIPDADFLLNWIFGFHAHRLFTHSILFAMGGGIIIYGIFNSSHKKSYAIATTVGILAHLLLDLPDVYGVPLFWPLATQISLITTTPQTVIPLFAHTLENTRVIVKNLLVDTSLGIIWILWLWFRNRIRF